MILKGIARILNVLIGVIFAVVVAVTVFFFISARWLGQGLETADPAAMVIGVVRTFQWLVEYLATVGLARTVLPGLLVVIVGEVMQIRAFYYYVVGGGLAASGSSPITVTRWMMRSPSKSFRT